MITRIAPFGFDIHILKKWLVQYFKAHNVFRLRTTVVTNTVYIYTRLEKYFHLIWNIRSLPFVTPAHSDNRICSLAASTVSCLYWYDTPNNICYPWTVKSPYLNMFFKCWFRFVFISFQAHTIKVYSSKYHLQFLLAY